MKTVFYAWQSDLPNKTNRTFLEKCLERAIAEVNATRHGDDRLVLDKDTDGIGGMPKVAEVVLAKIAKSTLFVADLSTVTTVRNDLRPSANPNVLIELGYALRVLGEHRIVAVLNRAFGSTDDLPFDLKHRRFPLTYELGIDAAPDERNQIQKALISRLTAALAGALAHAGGDEDEFIDLLPPHAAAPANEPSFFDSSAGHVARTESRDDKGNPSEFVFWHFGPCAWLRVIPATNRDLGRAALAAAMKEAVDPILPFGYRRSGRLVSNYQGVVAIGFDGDNPPSIAGSLTQVFRTGEVWGMYRIPPAPHGSRDAEIHWSQIVETFELALDNYLRFARLTLDLALPIQMVAGLAMVRDSLLVHGTGPAARFLDNVISYSFTVDEIPVRASSLLAPFYEKTWDACAMRYESVVDGGAP